MSTEFNELLVDSSDERAQVLIIGKRAQVQHIINEFHVKQLADRSQFSPLIPAPFGSGKWMSLLLR
jgi:hypothetical protein